MITDEERDAFKPWEHVEATERETVRLELALAALRAVVSVSTDEHKGSWERVDLMAAYASDALQAIDTDRKAAGAAR